MAILKRSAQLFSDYLGKTNRQFGLMGVGAQMTDYLHRLGLA